MFYERATLRIGCHDGRVSCETASAKQLDDLENLRLLRLSIRKLPTFVLAPSDVSDALAIANTPEVSTV